MMLDGLGVFQSLVRGGFLWQHALGAPVIMETIA